MKKANTCPKKLDNNLRVFLEKKLIQAKVRDLKWREKHDIVWFFVQQFVQDLKQDQIKKLYVKYYEKDGTPKRQPPGRSSRWSQLMDRIHA